MSEDKPKGPKIAIIGTGRNAFRVIAALGGKPEEGEANAKINDPISLTPNMQGPHGKAWRRDLDALRRNLNIASDQDSTMVDWIIEAPWAHPAWHSYALTLIHLRPMPGKPVTAHVALASHELWLHAMNPDCDRQAVIKGEPVGGIWLEPMNFAAQLSNCSDAVATGYIQNAIQMVCDGILSPDTDFREQWIELFGDNMLKNRSNRPPKTVN